MASHVKLEDAPFHLVRIPQTFLETQALSGKIIF